MKITDYRHHGMGPSDIVSQAKAFLDEIAATAMFPMGSAEHYQRNRDKYPDHFHNRPGAWIEKLPAEKRAILANLKSDPGGSVPRWLSWLRHPGHPDNKIGGVLEWSPPTVWKLGR